MGTVDEWLARVTSGAKVNGIATKSRLPQKTLSNHVNAGVLKAEEVIEIARAYRYPAVAALVELGLLREDEAGDAAKIAVPRALREASARQLADEVDRRLKELEERQRGSFVLISSDEVVTVEVEADDQQTRSEGA